MARALTANMITAIQQGTIRPVLLAAIETSGATVRCWTGIGDLVWDSNTYTGTGNLGGVGPVRETVDTEATNLQFMLSGVPSALISVALGQIRWNKPAKLWLGLLESEALVADPYLIFSGYTDVPTIDDGADTATIAITAESRLADLRRPRTRRYTPEDQHIDYPNDKGFDYVASLQDAEIIFGG